MVRLVALVVLPAVVAVVLVLQVAKPVRDTGQVWDPFLTEEGAP